MPDHTTVPRSIGRVLDLLEIVVGSGSCNLTTAAAHAELTPTTALRHLKALEARGYLVRDDQGTFSAGPTLVRMAVTTLDDGPMARLVAAARPHLDALAATTGESAYLAVSDGRRATYVAMAESARAIRHVGWVGSSVPLADTAVGQALGDPGRTAVRTGAVEPDITAVARALPGRGEVEAALSVIGPSHRMGRGRVAEVRTALESAVEALARDLGRSIAAAAS